MSDINSVVLIGRLTRDIELRFSASGFAIGKTGIAVNQNKKDASGNWTTIGHFFDVTILGKTAENVAKYAKKGAQIGINGHLELQQWEKDGNKYSKVVIVADNVQFCGAKQDSQNAPAPSPNKSLTPQSKPYANRGYNNAPAPAAENQGGFPEDIPYQTDDLDILF